MGTSKTMNGKCAQCGFEGDHDIVAMHADGIGFCFGMECPACGKLVPEKAWLRYLKTGDVVIPNLKRSFKRGVNEKTNLKASRNYM